MGRKHDQVNHRAGELLRMNCIWRRKKLALLLDCVLKSAKVPGMARVRKTAKPGRGSNGIDTHPLYAPRQHANQRSASLIAALCTLLFATSGTTARGFEVPMCLGIANPENLTIGPWEGEATLHQDL